MDQFNPQPQQNIFPHNCGKFQFLPVLHYFSGVIKIGNGQNPDVVLELLPDRIKVTLHENLTWENSNSTLMTYEIDRDFFIETYMKSAESQALRVIRQDVVYRSVKRHRENGQTIFDRYAEAGTPAAEPTNSKSEES